MRFPKQRINKCYEQLKALKSNQQPVNDVNKQIDALKGEIETLNAEMISKLGRNKDKSFLFEVDVVFFVVAKSNKCILITLKSKRLCRIFEIQSM